MSLEPLKEFSCFGVPESRGLIVTTRQYHLAVRREGNGIDPIRMSLELSHRASCIEIDEMRVSVIAPYKRKLTVRRYGSGSQSRAAWYIAPSKNSAVRIPYDEKAIIADREYRRVIG